MTGSGRVLFRCRRFSGNINCANNAARRDDTSVHVMEMGREGEGASYTSVELSHDAAGLEPAESRATTTPGMRWKGTCLRKWK